MKSFRLFALLAVAMFVASSAEAKLFGGCGLFGKHKSCCEPVCCEAEPTCCEAEPTCCEEPAPCCEAAPVCEEAPAPCCEAAPTCCEEPAPCCEEAPVCCEEPACCPKKECFLKRLFGKHRNHCCCN